MKKLQILRVDNDEVQKIDLQIGENIIGRSVTTACNDDRVIKQAVIINVKSDNEMTITPYQVAACYMKSIESSRWKLLKLGTTVPIKAGDVCLLLPKKCWFKIISATSVMENAEEYSLKRKANDDVESDMHEKRLCSELGEGDNFRSACNESDKTANNNNLTETPVEKDTSKDNLLVERDEKLIQEPCNMDKPSAMKEDESEVQDEDRMSIEAPANDSTNIQENVELPSASKDNENDVAKDTEPSVSNTPADSEAVGNASASNIIREKCKYGKDCYRRNTQHKAKFSHPGDSDYDTPDNREECPYGDKCYRKNTMHKMQYKHSSTSVAKGISKRKRKKPQVQKPLDTLGAEDSSAEDLGEESEEESVDESEYEPSSDVESSNDDDDDENFD